MNLAVFGSGFGSNFTAISNAIKDKKIDAKITLVVVDNPNAQLIQKAKDDNIKTFVFNPKDYNSKKDYELEIVKQCKDSDVDLIVLAGYMRILESTLLSEYPNKIINIHPSLLPAFKGKDAIGQAIDYGVKVMGVSVHYVNEQMDGGTIIDQEAFYVSDMNKEEIEHKIHSIEHVLYPKVIQKIIKGGN